MKKRWLKLAAIGIMAGTLVVQAPVATYAGENGEAVVQQENGVGSEVATAEHVAKHLRIRMSLIWKEKTVLLITH